MVNTRLSRVTNKRITAGIQSALDRRTAETNRLPLRRYHRVLAAAASTSVDILVIGDSVTEGKSGTRTSRYTNQLLTRIRRNWQPAGVVGAEGYFPSSYVVGGITSPWTYTGTTWVNNGAYTNLAAQGTMTLVTSTFGTEIPSTITGIRIAIRSEDVGATTTQGTFLIDEIRAERKTVTADTAINGNEAWELISQAVVTNLRTTKTDTKLLLVPGENYSKVQLWTGKHPDGWITDSAGNYRYESHQYYNFLEDSAYGPGAYAAALVAAGG